MAKWTVQDLDRTSWFCLLQELVNTELEKLASNRQDNRPALEKERESLSKRVSGLAQSLGDPDLKPGSRAVLQDNLEHALGRQREIESEIAQIEAIAQKFETIVSPEMVVDRLNRLDEVLGANNPSRTNLELSLHIDKIECYSDGHVTVRTCKLGALAECMDLIPRTENQPAASQAPNEKIIQAKPRNRGLRCLGDYSGDRQELMNAAHHAADVNRFSGLGPEWFWEDTFHQEPKTHWFQENGAAVAAKRAETGWSFEKLSKHFGKSIPTLRRALRYAECQSFQNEGGNSIAS